MNASFRRVHFTFGSVALIALAVGCSRREERRPAEPVGRTPTFESQVPAEPGAQPPGERRGQETHRAAPRPGESTEPGQGDMGAMSERRLCEELSQGASLSVSNVPGGAQIAMTPRSESDALRIRSIAHQIDAHLTALEQAEQPTGDPSSRCPLFDMARVGARGRVVEGPDGLRIIFTSEDTAGVSIVRQQAQMFVQSIGERKAH